MAYRIAPSCRAVLDQANQLWPNRNKASDGTVGDLSHSSRSSDHNPSADGWVHAVDLTHDPANGCDAHEWARSLAARKDPRVKYLISNGQICSWLSVAGWPAWAWRPYGGSNPHTKHAHLSIHHTAAARNDTSPWFKQAAAPTSWRWENHMPKPDEFTSAAACPTGGYWMQKADGSIFAYGGAPWIDAYNAHDLGGNVRYFVALVPTLTGGYVQIAQDGATYAWNPK